MKIRFDDNLVFGIVVAAVSLPIVTVLGYLYFSSAVDAFRHPQNHPGLYQHFMRVIALVVFTVVVMAVSLMVGRRTRDDSGDGSD